MIECVSETIVFLYRKRTALPAPLCREVLVAEVPDGALCRHTSDVLLRFRKHPHLEECPVRDYFSETDASLLGEIHRWGLFF